DYSVLPDLVRRYAALYPQVEISLLEATSDVQITALLEGRGHAGLVIPPERGLPEALAYRPLVEEPLVAAVPESWVDEGRLPADQIRLTPAAVHASPMIIFPR